MSIERSNLCIPYITSIRMTKIRDACMKDRPCLFPRVTTLLRLMG